MVDTLTINPKLGIIANVIEFMNPKPRYTLDDLEAIRELVKETPMRLDGVYEHDRLMAAQFDHIAGAVEYYFN